MSTQPSICIKSSFKWDTMAIIVTIVFNAILISFVISAFKSSIILLELVSLLMTVSCALFVPVRLIVSKDTIIIRRPIGTVKIDMSDIMNCSIVENEERFFDKTIRTCGSGGAYGYWGYFRHDVYGKIRLFVTHKKQCFLIKLNNGKYYVISSKKREKIVKFIINNIKSH